MILEETKLMKELLHKDAQLYEGIRSVYSLVKPLLDHRIAIVFPMYTQHDTGHSIRIIEYMSNIVNDIKSLNALELSILIYSALLHDIGMAIDQTEISKIERGEIKYKGLDFQALLKNYDNDTTIARQEYIRMVHAELSAQFIKKNLKEKLIIPGMPHVSFVDNLALVCEAHTKDIGWVRKNLSKRDVKGEFEINTQFCAMVLRLADILDFDSLRTPPKLYQSLALSKFSEDEWLQHFSITNQNKITENSNGIKVIEFHGNCSEPSTHRRISKYMDWVNKEIEYAIELSREYSEKHKFHFYHKVSNYITSGDYSIVDMKFQVNYKNIINLLMGEALYGNKEMGIRELIQNSIDACEVKKEILDKNTGFELEEYSPRIVVILDEINNKVVIKDNGVGMNLTIIKNYFLEVGASYYKSNEFALSNFSYNPIGHYGIGFLSSFMLSDEVTLKTKAIDEEIVYEVNILKSDDFVSIKEKKEPRFNGTEITLKYNQVFEVWDKKESLREFIEKEFLIDNVKIQILDRDNPTEIIDINNQLKTEKSENEIDLSPYLKDVKVKVEISPLFRERIFKENLTDVAYIGVPYFFDGQKLYQIDDAKQVFPINEYLSINNTLGVLEISIIRDGDELDQVANIINNADDIEEYYNENFHPDKVSLVTLPNLLENPPTGYVFTDEIVPGLKFDDFSDYSHDNSSGTFFSFEERSFHSLNDTLKSISLKQNLTILKGELYVRGVLVKKTNYSELVIQNAISGVYIKELKINVINKSIRPNVARSDISIKEEEILYQSIYQAFCIYLYEGINDFLEKSIFLDYIKKYHNYDTSLLHDEFKELLK